MNLAIRQATPAARLPTRAVSKVPFSLGMSLKWGAYADMDIMRT